MTKKQINYRPPVVVVLGHVDHGKTTLLDHIRHTNITASEAGQITQKIGAYEAHIAITGYNTDKITFIDTPGHEAFTKLRLRGSQIADIAILVVSAVDSVMPQTEESISHIQQAGIPFVVAINKTDLPDARVEKIKKDLAKHNTLVEDMGGKIVAVPISAITGEGVKDLLEALLYIASTRELSYDPAGVKEIYTIETNITKAGHQVSCIIKNGSLSVGETVYAQDKKAKVRALITDTGKHIKTVIPSQPFVILGFHELPDVGVRLSTHMQETAEKQQEEQQTQSIEELLKQKEEKKLRIILKADSNGSLEAITAVLDKKDNIQLILASVGEISKSDVFLAKVSKAIIVGFVVPEQKMVAQIAEQEKVVIKTYNIIYKLLEELEEVSMLMQEHDDKEKRLKGEAKVLANFIIENARVAGIKVEKGKIGLTDTVECIRGNNLIGKAKVSSLKQKSIVINEVKKSEEAGIVFSPQLDFKVGDVIKSYSI